MAEHPRKCRCGGTNLVEAGPAGATYSAPCPGPSERVNALLEVEQRQWSGRDLAVIDYAELAGGVVAVVYAVEHDMGREVRVAVKGGRTDFGSIVRIEEVTDRG